MFILWPVFVVILILGIFFVMSFSLENNLNQMSIFECGYKSYFFSRFSFSIQFFFISMIFLFLDLEICITILMLLESIELNFFSSILLFFIVSLLVSLLLEWSEEKLEWTV